MRSALVGFVLGAVIALLGIAMYSAVQMRGMTARVDRLERIAIQQQRINTDVDNRLRRMDHGPLAP